MSKQDEQFTATLRTRPNKGGRTTGVNRQPMK